MMYGGAETVVRMKSDLTDWFKVQVGSFGVSVNPSSKLVGRYKDVSPNT